MTFEEFLNGRLADLVRFAVILCGNLTTGEDLVQAAFGQVYNSRRPVDDGDVTFAELRTWVVRAYLSEGMQLGQGPAADVDRPIVEADQADDDWDDLTARFVTSSKLQRTVTALHYYERLDLAGVAATMGSTAEGIELYLRRVRRDLNIRTEAGAAVPGANSEADVSTLLELYGDDVDPDVRSLAGAVLARLPDTSAEDAAREQAERERVEREAAEAKANAERERVEREAAEAKAKAERERVKREAAETAAKAKAERERVEREAAEAEAKAERERVKREAAETAAKAKAERERVEREAAEAEAAAKAKAEQEREAAEAAAKAKAERERVEREAAEAEAAAKAKAEQEREAAEAAAKAKAEQEREAAEAAAKAQAEREKAEREKAERDKARVAAKRAERDRVRRERSERRRTEREAAKAAAAAKAQRQAAEAAATSESERQRSEPEARQDEPEEHEPAGPSHFPESASFTEPLVYTDIIKPRGTVERSDSEEPEPTLTPHDYELVQLSELFEDSGAARSIDPPSSSVPAEPKQRTKRPAKSTVRVVKPSTKRPPKQAPGERGNGKQTAKQTAKQTSKPPAKKPAKPPAKKPAKPPVKKPAKKASKPAAATRRKTRRRILLAAAGVVAITLLTYGIVAISSDDHTTSGATTSTQKSGLPSPVVRPLPGTVVLGQWAGIGSATVHPGTHAVAAGHELTINVVCAGKGPVIVGPVALGQCSAPVAGAATGTATSSLEVKAPTGTRWRFALTDQPQSGTNGALAQPPDPALTDPHGSSVVGFRAGTGVATVQLQPPKKTKGPYNMRIALTCHGDGVTISSAVPQVNGKYTKTCFSGWSYEFDVSAVALPAALTVQATANTAWRLVVISV